mmetsp:Transcript_4065/g.6786  ORF Transcript_4065/g.6786 Transcript_4065/m.6786 type:complete len:335 (+) Transcript_4065:1002-2006(+)
MPLKHLQHLIDSNLQVREQVIRGLSSSNAKSKLNGSKNESRHHKIVSTFLSDLCNKPSNQKLTNDEKRKWKECEWERLYVEIERARAAARIMAERLQIKPAEEINEKELFGDDETDEKQTSNVEKDPQDELLGRDLDNEVVRTETRSLRDLKLGITGCPSPRKGKTVTKSFQNTLDVVNEENHPQSQTDVVVSDENEKQVVSDSTLRLMKMVDYLESAQQDGNTNLDASSKAMDDNDEYDENDTVGSVEEANDLAKLEVDTSLLPLSRVSTLGSENEHVLHYPTIEDSPTQMYRRSESSELYEKSFQESKATLSSALDFLKELSDHDTSEKSDS